MKKETWTCTGHERVAVSELSSGEGGREKCSLLRRCLGGGLSLARARTARRLETGPVPVSSQTTSRSSTTYHSRHHTRSLTDTPSHQRAHRPLAHSRNTLQSVVRRMSAVGEGRSIARVYAHANESFGREWWDYDTLQIQWGPQDKYEVVKKVGRGKVS